jgi:hypothetical protein
VKADGNPLDTLTKRKIRETARHKMSSVIYYKILASLQSVRVRAGPENTSEHTILMRTGPTFCEPSETILEETATILNMFWWLGH